jgi:hypothetical protein
LGTSNRRKVDAATMVTARTSICPAPADAGIAAFGRQFYAQSEQGLSAGRRALEHRRIIPDFYFERLAAATSNTMPALRRRRALPAARAILGPKVAGHQRIRRLRGDSVADYFRKYALGPIVGKRTWGGLMGIGNELPMIDGGRVACRNAWPGTWSDGKSNWIVGEPRRRSRHRGRQSCRISCIERTRSPTGARPVPFHHEALAKKSAIETEAAAAPTEARPG